MDGVPIRKTGRASASHASGVGFRIRGQCFTFMRQFAARGSSKSNVLLSSVYASFIGHLLEYHENFPINDHRLVNKDPEAHRQEGEKGSAGDGEALREVCPGERIGHKWMRDHAGEPGEEAIPAKAQERGQAKALQFAPGCRLAMGKSPVFIE
jgi:hypothetical protein